MKKFAFTYGNTNNFKHILEDSDTLYKIITSSKLKILNSEVFKIYNEQFAHKYGNLLSYDPTKKACIGIIVYNNIKKKKLIFSPYLIFICPHGLIILDLINIKEMQNTSPTINLDIFKNYQKISKLFNNTVLKHGKPKGYAKTLIIFTKIV